MEGDRIWHTERLWCLLLGSRLCLWIQWLGRRCPRRDFQDSNCIFKEVFSPKLHSYNISAII